MQMMHNALLSPLQARFGTPAGTALRLDHLALSFAPGCILQLLRLQFEQEATRTGALHPKLFRHYVHFHTAMEIFKAPKNYANWKEVPKSPTCNWPVYDPKSLLSCETHLVTMDQLLPFSLTYLTGLLSG